MTLYIYALGLVFLGLDSIMKNFWEFQILIVNDKKGRVYFYYTWLVTDPLVLPACLSILLFRGFISENSASIV